MWFARFLRPPKTDSLRRDGWCSGHHNRVDLSLTFVDIGSDIALTGEQSAQNDNLQWFWKTGVRRRPWVTANEVAAIFAGKWQSLWTSNEYWIADLLIQSPKSFAAILSRLLNLQQVSFVDWMSEAVNLLLGCHLPRARLIIDQPICNRGAQSNRVDAVWSFKWELPGRLHHRGYEEHRGEIELAIGRKISRYERSLSSASREGGGVFITVRKGQSSSAGWTHWRTRHTCSIGCCSWNKDFVNGKIPKSDCALRNPWIHEKPCYTHRKGKSDKCLIITKSNEPENLGAVFNCAAKGKGT